MKWRTVLEGVGAALLLLLPYFCKFLLPSNLVLYHLRLPVASLVGGILVDLLLFSILITGFLVAVHYLPTPAQRIVEALFAGMILWGAVHLAFGALIQQQFRIEHLDRIWAELAVGISLISGALAWFFPRGSQLAVRAIRLCLAAFAFSVLWVVPELLHLALARPPGERTLPNRQSAGSNSGQRIVWILFDELSYRQAFEHPLPGIDLPNFDRLRAQSVSFSNLRPVGAFTELIIPSLFLNRRIDHTRSTVEGRLFYKDESDGRWLAYDPNATLFGLAQRNGWSTGIDGWDNPYCRDLASVLNACWWEPNLQPIQLYGASGDNPVLANAAVLPAHFLGLTPHRMTCTERHMQIYRNILAHARTLIDDDRLRFVFLHFPVPHSPAIYDRRQHRLRLGGTYLDSLVLADDTLGELLQEILASQASNRTTVIVTSDHSWRIYLVRPGEAWTDEEERASGGRFDDRPVLLIHFPDQQSGAVVPDAVPELLEHDMVAGMLLGQISKPEDLAALLSQNRR